MSFTDPIGDMLTRVRNASSARHEKVLVPASNLKARIAEVLKAEGFIQDFVLHKDDEPPGGHHHPPEVRAGPRARHQRHQAGVEAGPAALRGHRPDPPRLERHGHRHPLDLEGRHGRSGGPQAEGGRRAHLHRLVGDIHVPHRQASGQDPGEGQGHRGRNHGEGRGPQGQDLVQAPTR